MHRGGAGEEGRRRRQRRRLVHGAKEDVELGGVVGFAVGVLVFDGQREHRLLGAVGGLGVDEGLEVVEGAHGDHPGGVHGAYGRRRSKTVCERHAEAHMSEKYSII